MSNAITAIMIHQHEDRHKLAMEAIDAFCAQRLKLKKLIVINSTGLQFSYITSLAEVIVLRKPTPLSFQLGVSQSDSHLVASWPDDCVFRPEYLSWLEQHADNNTLVYPAEYGCESSDKRCRSIMPNTDRYLFCMPRVWLPGRPEKEIPFTDQVTRIVH